MASKQNDDLKVYRGKDAPPLKRSALILSSQIFEFIKNWKDSDTPEVKYPHINKYVERFGQRVVLMRDDLDQNGQQSDKLDDVLRKWPMLENYDSVRIIASELKKLAEGLAD